MTALKPIRLKIVGRGEENPGHWTVVDAETGRPIDGVVSVLVGASIASGKAAAQIELMKFDFTAEVEATAKRFGLEPAPRPPRDGT